MKKPLPVIEKKVVQPRIDCTETNFSAGALKALYEAMGQRIPGVKTLPVPAAAAAD